MARIAEAISPDNSRQLEADTYEALTLDAVPKWTAEELEVANSILVGGMTSMRTPSVNVEQDSIDGAIILMPQVARSVGWHQELTALVCTNYLYHVLQYVAALSLLFYISKEEHVMDAFSGQPYLCDFGIHLDRCTTTNDDPQCVGPGGTTMTPSRLYSFSLWSTRNFVRDSVTAVLPDEAREKKDLIDPGEYGVESYWCRLLCCVLFVTSITSEIIHCKDMANLLWYLPNSNEPWVVPKPDMSPSGSDDHTDVNHWTDRIEVKVAGMSVGWKIWNVIFVLLPKMLLVLLTTHAGIDFLMETAGIDDLIVNTVALGFILSMDQLLVQAMKVHGQTHKLLELCQSMQVKAAGQNWSMSDGELRQHYNATRGTWGTMLFRMFSQKLVAVYVVVLVTATFVMKYYFSHCERKDGRWVSKDLHVPLSTRFSWAHFLLPMFYSDGHVPEPVWSYSA